MTDEEISSGDNIFSPELVGLEINTMFTSSDGALRFITAYDPSDDTVVASFRGTINAEDWLYDLETFKTNPYVDSPEVYVHKGFYESYSAMKDEVSRSLAALSDEKGTNKVKITGHSLGAAQAMLLAYDMAKGNIHSLSALEVTSMYTFGCPRVGDASFASSVRSLNMVHNRVVHHRDIVPHVPTSGPLMAFEHTAREVYYEDEEWTPGKFTLCSDKDGEDDNCSRSLWSYSVQDHCEYVGVEICSPVAESLFSS
jgi:predicted lipase